MFVFTLTQMGLFAQEIPSFKTPILVTSAGQSVDFKTASMLIKRLDLQYAEDELITPEKLREGDFKTIIVVVGHSLKGLGAAGISEEDELQRVNDILEANKELGIPVVLFHLGGQGRRGPTSQPFIDAVLAHSSYVVVFAEGNTDKYFSNYTDEHNIPMTEIGKVADALNVIKAMFNVE